MGMRTSVPFKRGDLILSEEPLFTPFATWDDDTIQAAVRELPTAQKQEYNTLPYVISNAHHWQRIIFDAYYLPLSSSTPMKFRSSKKCGIFLKTLRFRSSCSPNVARVWDEKKNRMRLLAQRDIAKEEELFVSYGNILAPRKERKEELRKDFDLGCTCAVCALEGEALEESDKRREELGRLTRSIRVMGDDPRGGINAIHKTLELLREEGLTHYEDHLYYYGYLFCVGASDMPHAKEWATKAHEALVLAAGADGDGVELMRGYMEKPESHPCKGIFSRMVLSGPK
ncbi:hypothetical protein BOTBODRAFT_30504 [Botryobasidium botryosum FD-172 SS1]|uniref:SET domain-containing protein n=1 Tax=Botryobasidium botryosum (strain FD-172 SS1) TaxID=930990 RepID=A0A067MYZ5_BOTB1|nr:hypothetical protein BOTBODRAFT_30504 [Botryobasidium botryosum FD-172 SS1]